MKISELLTEENVHLDEGFADTMKRAMAAGALGLASLSAQAQPPNIPNTQSTSASQPEYNKLTTQTEYAANRADSSLSWDAGYLTETLKTRSAQLNPKLIADIKVHLQRVAKFYPDYATDGGFAEGQNYAKNISKNDSLQFANGTLIDSIKMLTSAIELERAVRANDRKKIFIHVREINHLAGH